MRWERLRLLLLLLAAVGAVAFGLPTALHLTGFRPGVTQENYERITSGMTLDEVQELMGGEGEEWGQFPTYVVRAWRGDDGIVVNVIFQDGGVFNRGWTKDGKGWVEVPPEPSFLARILDLPSW